MNKIKIVYNNIVYNRISVGSKTFIVDLKIKKKRKVTINEKEENEIEIF
jgi:hypothetical protein